MCVSSVYVCMCVSSVCVYACECLLLKKKDAYSLYISNHLLFQVAG